MSSSNIQRDNPTLTHTQYIPTLFLPFPGFYILEPHVFPIAASSINCSNFIILHAVITGSPPDLRNGKWVGRVGMGLDGIGWDVPFKKILLPIKPFVRVQMSVRWCVGSAIKISLISQKIPNQGNQRKQTDRKGCVRVKGILWEIGEDG